MFTSGCLNHPGLDGWVEGGDAGGVVVGLVVPRHRGATSRTKVNRPAQGLLQRRGIYYTKHYGRGGTAARKKEDWEGNE